MAIVLTQSGSAMLARQAAAVQQQVSDESLLIRIARGEQHAMRILFARHQVPVYRFVLRIVRDQAQAEDVLSETFFEAWKQAASFEGRSSVSTWLLAIARHRALSVLRRRSEAELDDATAQRIVDPADTPEIVLQKKESGELLRQCLETLRPQHGEIIDLVYYHEKSVAEVAEIVGVPEGTVKTRMFYARQKLAQMLERAGHASSQANRLLTSAQEEGRCPKMKRPRAGATPRRWMRRSVPLRRDSAIGS